MNWVYFLPVVIFVSFHLFYYPVIWIRCDFVNLQRHICQYFASLLRNDFTPAIGWWNYVTSCNAAFTAYFVSQSILLFQSNSRNEDMEWRHSDGEVRPGFFLPKGHTNINHRLFLPWRVLVQYLYGMISRNHHNHNWS